MKLIPHCLGVTGNERLEATVPRFRGNGQLAENSDAGG